MDEPTPFSQARRWIVCGLSATFLPPLIVLGLVAFEGAHGKAAGTDGFFVRMTVGIVAVWQCPVPLWAKIVGCVLYVPIKGIVLMVLCFQFACSIHERCL